MEIESYVEDALDWMERSDDYVEGFYEYMNTQALQDKEEIAEFFVSNCYSIPDLKVFPKPGEKTIFEVMYDLAYNIIKEAIKEEMDDNYEIYD